MRSALTPASPPKKLTKINDEAATSSPMPSVWEVLSEQASYWLKHLFIFHQTIFPFKRNHVFGTVVVPPCEKNDWMKSIGVIWFFKSWVRFSKKCDIFQFTANCVFLSLNKSNITIMHSILRFCTRRSLGIMLKYDVSYFIQWKKPFLYISKILSILLNSYCHVNYLFLEF